jgi:DNA topoisomerase I
MEDELDAIASGTNSRLTWLNGFYFGGAQGSEGSVARAGGLNSGGWVALRCWAGRVF